ncbi:hypothetical protein BBW65_05150 [Helicobacter enhydrae]|uniref:Autotransporter domain-containing protein n=1 Tax=Helicobacter enhydrae TaxID=222136 RepID=A0A1B1U614_9HELI|nr:autotransporter outer membrane beta-barrel domain-containing protein [Helicobacter enhydrae]ANV98223.1 hypothetical protein BBW65_05150 [Helicobacter enhydrae]
MMKSYRPLIATSLALALSVSVASATDANCPSGNTSTICYSTNGTDFKQFTGLTIGISGDFNKIQFAQLPSGTPEVGDFTLKFRKDGTTAPSSSEASVSGANAQLKLVSETKGLQLGSAGTSTLTIDFGKYEAQNFARKATLTFNGTTPPAAAGTPKTALKGNIKIIASAFKDDFVEATFKGDMIGNITLTRYEGLNSDPSDYEFIKSRFTFQDGASITGDLQAVSAIGGQDFIFEGGGGINGNIVARGGYVDANNVLIGAATNTTEVNITFRNKEGSTNIIKKGGSKGEILAAGAGNANNLKHHAHNRILFEGKGQIGGSDNDRMDILAAPRKNSVGGPFVGAQSYNLIKFNKQATLFLKDLKAFNNVDTDRRNIISLDLANTNRAGSDTNSLNIKTINADGGQGRNYIGKGFLTLSGGGTAKDLIINTESTENPTAANIAQGTLTADKIVSWNGAKNTILIENIVVNGGIFASKRGSNLIFITKDSDVGQNGIKNDGNTNKRGTDYSLYAREGGSNILNLNIAADTKTLSLKKRVTHDWAAWQTTFNLNGNDNKIEIKGNGTNGSINNIGLEVSGAEGTENPGMTFNFNGNNGVLDVTNGAASGGGNIIVGVNKGDKNAKLTFNVNGGNATIKGGITTQGGKSTTQQNTTTFNIANGKTLTIEGEIKQQQATTKGGDGTENATDSAQTIFNFNPLVEDSLGSRIGETTLKLKNNITNTSGNVVFNFNADNAQVTKVVSASPDPKITTTATGKTIFNLNLGNASATVTQAIESTDQGQTFINFNQNNSTLILTDTNGIKAGNNGTTSIIVGNAESPEQSVNAIIKGNVITQGHGSTTISFNSKDSSLTIKDSSSEDLKDIAHTAGTLEIDFHSQNGTFKNKVTTNTAGATTNIQVTAGQGEKGNSGIFEKEIQTNSGGSTNITLGALPQEQGQTDGKATLTLQGATNTITKLTANATESTLNLTNGTATITTTEIGNGSTLNLQASNGKIKTDTLKLSANATSATLNLSSDAQTKLGTPHHFNLLEIGKATSPTADTGLTADNLTFVVSVDTATTQTGSKIGGEATKSGGTYGHAYSDRIIVHNVGDNSQAKSADLVVIIDPDQIKGVHYTPTKGTETEHNIAVATIKNTSDNKALVAFDTNTKIIENGGELLEVGLVTTTTDENGKATGTSKDYTTYFLGKAISLGVDNTTQQALTSALSINYDLYIANLNSLNKRMGELRDNPYTQGVWARVFGGLQESNFGLGARTSYVTAQGGYDYALETEGAKNYIGLAFSYMHSKGESNKATQASNAINVSGINTIYLSNIQSSGYEIALYNSYVSNVGLYNDTIAKLSYITSDFSLSNSSDHNNTANNLGFTLSNEVGYRFILGEQQDYFIDPQLELSLGYLNQSDFTTKMKTRSGKGNQLKALQESVFLTRTRLGASFGKKIVEQDKNISLYVGTFYEYDLVTGGSNKLTTSTTKAYNPEFASNGRVVLNVGSNLELNQSTRVYVDVEKSFGDKLRTQLQFNLGARYSFGEKTSIENAKAQTTAPLRVGNTPTEETEKASIVPSGSQKVKDTGTKAANQ